ncbi:uncharacterized protein LOC126372885 [Pectinophora gossypiella]|uniref:uncharacterized protein LOC126372885 n=1 Tax=Pectinophora gossypiella TaxID=13191 RepID=UPI00214E9423|nr:uncharacterized protein LOC126372885 [Pectinophora gossypiella]
MYKFVLCALLAVAVADPEPGALFAPYPAPLAYSSSWLAPSTTTITKSASSVVHPSPYLYSSPIYSHFIKKRSAPLFPGYYAPSPYLAGSPLVTPALTTPIVNAPYWPAPALTYSAPAHFIKKRDVSLLPSTYIAPTTYTATAPVLTSHYAAAPILPSTPLYTSPYGLGYSHFIKKRSASLPVLPTTYYAPNTYSAPLLTSSYSYGAAPIVSSASYAYAASPYAYTSYIKK